MFPLLFFCHFWYALLLFLFLFHFNTISWVWIRSHVVYWWLFFCNVTSFCNWTKPLFESCFHLPLRKTIFVETNFFHKKNVFSLSKIAQRNGFQFLMLVCTCVTMSHKMFGVSQFKKSFADCLSKCRPPMPCSIRLVSYACSSFFIFMIHLNFSIISSLLFSRCGYVQCKTGLQSFSSYTTHKHS